MTIIQFTRRNELTLPNVFLCFSGIDETVRVVRAIGGTCIGYKVDISKKEDVYSAADAIRRDAGNVKLTYAIRVFAYFYLIISIR